MSGWGQTEKTHKYKPNLGQMTVDETKLVWGVVSSSIRLCIYSVCLVCCLYLVLTGTPEEPVKWCLTLVTAVKHTYVTSGEVVSVTAFKLVCNLR